MGRQECPQCKGRNNGQVWIDGVPTTCPTCQGQLWIAVETPPDAPQRRWKVEVVQTIHRVWTKTLLAPTSDEAFDLAHDEVDHETTDGLEINGWEQLYDDDDQSDCEVEDVEEVNDDDE
jgi:hypothetical protein